MKNIKLHASPNPGESATACPEVWDADGDSWDLAGRRSLNLRRQNLSGLLSFVVLLLVVVVLPRHLLLDKVVLLRRLLCLVLLCLVRRPAPPPPPPLEPTAHHICPTTCN
jgi:hypothetical protein